MKYKALLAATLLATSLSLGVNAESAHTVTIVKGSTATTVQQPMTFAVPDAQNLNITMTIVPSTAQAIKTNPTGTAITGLLPIDTWQRMQSTVTSYDSRYHKSLQKMLSFSILPGDNVNVAMSSASQAQSSTKEDGSITSTSMTTTNVMYEANVDGANYHVHMTFTSPLNKAVDYGNTNTEYIENHVAVPYGMSNNNTMTPVTFNYYRDINQWYAGETIKAPTSSMLANAKSETIVTTTLGDTNVKVTVATDNADKVEQAKLYAFTIANHVSIQDLVN